MNPRRLALTREAGLAAEHLAIGATALGRANYAEQAHYHAAFFALSVGIERSTKLAILLDFALEHGGAYPKSEVVTRYQHDLGRLLANLDQIDQKRRPAETSRLPSTQIHRGIIETLTEFSDNSTRYYNIDVVTEAQHSSRRRDPVAVWYERVTQPVLAAHYGVLRRTRDADQAAQVAHLLEGTAHVLFSSETGERIESVFAGAKATAAFQLAKPFERMYVLQVARFISFVIDDLGTLAQRQQLDVPYMNDFYRIFQTEDEVFRRRKTWSIYRP